MYLVKEAIDNITWNMTPIVYCPNLSQPLVAELLGGSDDLNTATQWKNKGGCLRATSISNRFLLPISEESTEVPTAKAAADLDRLRVYQYLTENLGMDEDKNFIYDRFVDGSPASKQECRKQLFQLVTRSKRVSRLAAYSYYQDKAARLAGTTPQRQEMPRRNLQHIWLGCGNSTASAGWKKPISGRLKERVIKKERMEKKKRNIWLKTPRLNCWRYKEAASLDEPFEYREISKGCSRWRMNRVADKVSQTASVQAQILDPTISEGPRAGHDTRAGYGLRASLLVCLKPSTTSFVNLGMALNEVSY